MHEEFKRNLKEQLRSCGSARYFKSVNKLSKNELKICLDGILRQNLGFWNLGNYGSIDEYKQVFRETFAKELKMIK